MIQIILVILLIIIIILFSSLEFFKNDELQVLTKEQLLNILLNNNDNYYERFTNLDLKVRNVNSIEEYKKKIIHVCDSCNSMEYKKILLDINKVNKILKEYKIIGFDGNKAANIKWKIGIVNNNLYENGLPHTRGDVIIIPKNLLNSYRLKNILLHEKIHVYQKMYSYDIQQYFENNGFVKSRYKNVHVRANPDIDEFIYKNKNNEEMMCIYIDNPNSILDVTYLPYNDIINEHPLEYMAYTIESKLNSHL